MREVVRYSRTMAKKPEFDWHLTDWMASTEMSQADLCRATGYPKAKMSELATGVSRYNRDVVNAISRALNIRPYELLMHPDDANAIKRLRDSAADIASVKMRETAEIQEAEPGVRKFRKKVG